MVPKDYCMMTLVCDLGCTIQELGEPSEHVPNAGKALLRLGSTEPHPELKLCMVLEHWKGVGHPELSKIIPSYSEGNHYKLCSYFPVIRHISSAWHVQLYAAMWHRQRGTPPLATLAERS